MKKIIQLTSAIILIGILAQTSSVFGQRFSATTLKAGYFDPKGSKAGFIFGGNYSWIIDESVDIGIAVDYFRKNHSEDSTEVQGDETLRIKYVDLTTNIIPVYGLINIKFPAGMYMDYFISGGLGYEMLIRKEQTYGAQSSKKSRFYSGFKWMVSAGIMYRIGSNSSFIAEAFYDGTTVSREKKDEPSGLARYEVDLSGFGIRAGIRMGFH